MAWELSYETPKKISAKYAKSYISELLPDIADKGIKTLLVTDGAYFKYLTGAKKADPFYGEMLPCSIEGYEYMMVFLSLNFQALVYNPLLQGKMDRSLSALKKHLTGQSAISKKDIIKYSYYPKTVTEIKKALQSLHQYNALSCDIETTSLNFWEAELETIAFAWDKHHFISFCIGRDNDEKTTIMIQDLLREFFISYNGILLWYNANYDCKILTYRLWMKNLSDYPGMQKGINVMTKNFQDVKIIAYLATNNAVENKLSLKEQSAEYMGNYGIL